MDHCFICLTDTPPLVESCEPNTCHNLNVHVACLRGAPQICSICKQPYPSLRGGPEERSEPPPEVCASPSVLRRARSENPPEGSALSERAAEWHKRRTLATLLISAWSCIAFTTFVAFAMLIVYIQHIPPGLIAVLCCCMFAVIMIAYIQIRAALVYATVERSHLFET